MPEIKSADFLQEFVDFTTGEKQADDLVVIDFRNQSPFLDYFIIGSARNGRLAKAIIENVEDKANMEGYVAKHIDVDNSSKWFLIDLGNILSVKTLRSVCVVDLEKIDGDVLITIGKSGEVVNAINRGDINADKLIVYKDQCGIFGSPTSDTLRTAVTSQTKQILVMIICFSKSLKDEQDEAMLLELYKKYANAENIKRILL